MGRDDPVDAEVAAPQSEFLTVTVDLAWLDGDWRNRTVCVTTSVSPMTGPQDQPWDAVPFDETLAGFTRLDEGGPVILGIEFPNPIGWAIDKFTGFVGGVATVGFEMIIDWAGRLGGRPSHRCDHLEPCGGARRRTR